MVVDPRNGKTPMRFSVIMTRNRFRHILRCLQYTDKSVLSFVDKFFQVRQMLESWNDSM